MSKKSILLVVLFMLLIVAGVTGYFIIKKQTPQYSGFRSFKVLNMNDSTLNAEVVVGIKNVSFLALTLEKLKAELKETGVKIGDISVDTLVELPTDSVVDLKFHLNLRLKETLPLLERLQDTLHLSVTGKAIAGVSFLSIPVFIDIPLPLEMGKSLFSGDNKSSPDSLISVKALKGLTLEGDSVKFDLVIEINNPYNIELQIESIDSGFVITGEKTTGSISLEQPVNVGRNESGVEAVINSSCYVGDLISASPSTLLGLFTSGGKIKYEVKGLLVVTLVGKESTIPLFHKGSFDLKEILKP
jgi:LEA14-like dessication related protein